MTNRLKKEKSPYLLMHAENPVEWYPWGDEAFRKAKDEDKPIFFSIGYSTCHWCHVMEKESFEDADLAGILNEHFVSIKVDREERPDIDNIYMTVCHAMTGSGGWPLSIFMTPEGKPFYAGTYFPKRGRMGMPGFIDIIAEIAALWRDDRGRLVKVGEDVTSLLRSDSLKSVGEAAPESAIMEKAYRGIADIFDKNRGGFGRAPKFPVPHRLTFLLRWYKRSGDKLALEMVVKTLDEMRGGGIFDQVGFGFHRYSTDERWLVPHFEKMLYDQALLAVVYIEAFQVTGDARFAETAREIFTYVLRDMTSPEGGFYSAEDADTEGREGLFYLFTPGEVRDVLGEKDGDLFCRFYDIKDGGNFEDGMSIPNVKTPMGEFAEREGIDVGDFKKFIDGSRARLHAVREKRAKPLKDDKIITAWNGLMVAALAKGYQALGDRDYLDAAERGALFVLNNLKSKGGRLKRRFRNGEAAFPGFVDDYAFFVWGLVELYEAEFRIDFLREAVALNDVMLGLFWDEDGGGLFFSRNDGEKLIIRKKEIYDGATPSGNSVAAKNLLRLAKITGDVRLEERAEELIRSFLPTVGRDPHAYTQFLEALDFLMGPSREIVISGYPDNPITRGMVESVQRRFIPNKVLIHALSDGDLKELSEISLFLSNMDMASDKPAAYICEGYACRAPIYDIETLNKALT
ncbi:MAG: thioredoxin domain-containing protein [Deltaproteobacteria bacterium]|uniref:Thioredoxin domain-containing protein n=1 Tax=Candidatus Zymogenus saltonus TaxID=2844893 RepID=A0A9D8KER1_9DELT|nr:thioredoxin domain-containing protein [Candidatus Zymogenus saltonus]